MTPSRPLLPLADAPIAEVHRAGLTGPQDIGHVHGALAELWQLGAPAGPTDERWRLEFEIAVAEVAANVARHVASHSVQVTFAFTASLNHTAVAAVFEDSGVEPRLPDRIGLPDAAAETGRGLAIAQRCLDTLRFERVDLVNRWLLIKGRDHFATD